MVKDRDDVFSLFNHDFLLMQKKKEKRGSHKQKYSVATNVFLANSLSFMPSSGFFFIDGF